MKSKSSSYDVIPLERVPPPPAHTYHVRTCWHANKSGFEWLAHYFDLTNAWTNLNGNTHRHRHTNTDRRITSACHLPILSRLSLASFVFCRDFRLVAVRVSDTRRRGWVAGGNTRFRANSNKDHLFYFCFIRVNLAAGYALYPMCAKRSLFLSGARTQCMAQCDLLAGSRTPNTHTQDAKWDFLLRFDHASGNGNGQRQ